MFYNWIIYVQQEVPVCLMDCKSECTFIVFDMIIYVLFDNVLDCFKYGDDVETWILE